MVVPVYIPNSQERDFWLLHILANLQHHYRHYTFFNLKFFVLFLIFI